MVEQFQQTKTIIKCQLHIKNSQEKICKIISAYLVLPVITNIFWLRNPMRKVERKTKTNSHFSNLRNSYYPKILQKHGTSPTQLLNSYPQWTFSAFDFLISRSAANHQSIFRFPSVLFFFSPAPRPKPHSTPPLLNTAVPLHSVFTKTAYNQTSNWLQSVNAQRTLQYHCISIWSAWKTSTTDFNRSCGTA